MLRAKSIAAVVFAATVVVAAAAPLRAKTVELITMPYVEQSDIVPAAMPTRDFIAALDDNRDGVADADVWAAIQAKVQTEIDGALGQRYATPFSDPLPALVKLAAVRFAIEAVYNHRGMSGEKSPWVVDANAMRKKLSLIADGEESLAPEQRPSRPSGSVIAEPSRTFSDRPAI